MIDFLAISLDTYNKKEYIIYHYCKERKVVSEIRELGKLLFDVSEPKKAAYLANLKIPVLLTDDFMEKQRHLSLNEMHRYSSYDILKEYYADSEKSELLAFYKNDRLYMGTQKNFKSLFQYYLDVLYADNIFPRRCKHCNEFFLAKTNLFDVLCSDCRQNSKTEKAARYKENHDNDYEAQYMKVYQLWYTRIRRSKKRAQLTDDNLQTCNDIFSRFTSESYKKRNDVRNGDISACEFEEWIAEFETQMIDLFRKAKISIPHWGIEK